MERVADERLAQMLRGWAAVNIAAQDDDVERREDARDEATGIVVALCDMLGIEYLESRERGQVGVCEQCSGTGWLFDQGYGDAPAGWVPVQRCDTCQRWADDEDAAAGAALAHGGVPVEFFQEGPDEDGNETDPGDWCILPGGIHQACAVCGFDIERTRGIEWVDRGNSFVCHGSIPASFHAPAAWSL